MHANPKIISVVSCFHVHYLLSVDDTVHEDRCITTREMVFHLKISKHGMNLQALKDIICCH